MSYGQKVVSADSASSFFFFLVCYQLTNCAMNGEQLIPNTTLVNSSSLGSSLCFKDHHNFLSYGWCIGCIPIIKYISAALHILDILFWHNFLWFCNIFHQTWVALTISILYSQIFWMQYYRYLAFFYRLSRILLLHTSHL